MERIFRKTEFIHRAAIMLLLLATSATAWAQTSASYRAYNTGTKAFETLTANDCTPVTSSTTTMGANNTVTWYVVNSNVSVSDSRIEVFGTVNLILADDKRMRAEKGLHVPNGVTLNIYGQNNGTGHLYSATEESRVAGIGGNNDETSGTITIHGGSIEAYGNYQSSAIGGGRAAHGGTTTIYGGTVNALGGTYAAGIGGGANGNGGTITITGGTVIARAGTADAVDNSQAIGSGAIVSGGTLTLGDMMVYADENAVTPVASANRENTCRSKYAKLVSCTTHNYVNDECIYCGALDNVPYLAYQTSTKKFTEQTVKAPAIVYSNTTSMGAAGTETWYVVRKNLSISSRIKVNGTVHLILCDGKKLTASAGITVHSGNTLNIHGQSGGSGTLVATTPSEDYAGIGSEGNGGDHSTILGTINIHGGKITAKGDMFSAGIGGGINSGGGNVNIYGGTIMATAGEPNYGQQEAIGQGSSGFSVTRTLADGLRVSYKNNNNYTIADYGDRLATLNQKDVKVEPCTGHNLNSNNKCYYCGLTCYTITYNSNGATGGSVPASTTHVNNDYVTVQSNTGNLVRTGYTFSGWNTKANGTGSNYAEGASFTITGNVTLYAKWTLNTYTVHFNKNHDDATGTMGDQTFTYNKSQKLTANAFTHNGYTFIGWSTTADGSVSYTNGQSVNNLTTQNGAVVNLYAVWQLNTYSITYDLNQGSVATPNPTSYTVASDAITLVNPTREGYTFTGWTGTGLNGPTMTVTIPQGSVGDRSYQATWALTYTIGYDLAGGSLVTPNPTTYTEVSDAITLVNPTRDGYTFAGWTGTDLDEPTINVTIANGSTGDRSYTATWTISIYTITYDLDGGSVATPNPASYTYLDEDITLVNPTREGYYFVGWTGTDLTEPTQNVTIPTNSLGNRSYTAVWTLIYTISYDGLEEGSFPTEHPTTYTELSETFTLVNPVRELYDFAGWTGTGLSAPTMTVTIAKGSTGNRSYHATWSLKEGQYVSYNPETGEYEAHAVSSPPHFTTTDATTIGTAGKVTWYLVKDAGVTASNRLTVNGTVNMILADGASLSVPKGITVHSGNTLNIYGQAGGTGSLNATVYSDNNAAIGTENNYNTGNKTLGTITIHGGNITATNSTSWSAGIGGGVGGGGGSIAIYGGTVNATASSIPDYGLQEAIGCGSSGASVAKTLADGLCVYVGNSTTPVNYANRIGSLSNKVVKVKPCAEHNWDGSQCTYCGAYQHHQIFYDGNGYTDGDVPEVATFNVEGIIVATGTVAEAGTMERTGYTFAGWNTETDGSGTAYAPGETITLRSDLTLYAQWSPIQYTITYILDGGYEPTIPNPVSYTIESEDITLNNPTRVDIDEVNGTTTNYLFMGWTGTDLDEATKTVFIPHGSIGDRTYTATWDVSDIPFEGIEIDHDCEENEVGRFYIKMPSPGYVDSCWDEELGEEVLFINGAEETPKIVNIPEWFTSAFKVYDDGGKDESAQSNPSESHITTLILNAPVGKAFSVQGALDIGTRYYDTDWLKIYDGTGTDNEIHCATDGEIDPFVTSSNSIRFDLHIEDGQYPSIMDLTVSVIDAPTVVNLVENSLTPNGATVSWTGSSDSYNLQYAEGDPFMVIFSEGFEDGSLPEGWTTSSDSYWDVGFGTGHEDYTDAATGNYNATCYYGGNSEDNYLITPVMDLSGVASATLTFNYRNVDWGSDLNKLHVYYSVDGGSWTELYSNDTKVRSWTLVTVPLQGLAANYQIGFKCETMDSYGMGIDDVKVFTDNPSLVWTTVENAASPYTFDNLDFETTYAVRVIGTQPDRISNILSFTTLERCPVPTNLEIVENSLTACGATVNWKGFSDNYNIKLGEVNYLDLSQAEFTTTTDDYPWTVVKNNQSGSLCAKSTNNEVDNSVSDMVLEVTLATDETLTFSAKVSSESGWDKAYFSIDGDNKINGISGDDDWIDYSYPLTAGTYTLRWYYAKDSSTDSYDDCFYVDDIRITNGSTEVGNYTSDTNSYTLTGLSAGTTYKVQVQADGGTDGTSQWSSPIMFTTSYDLILANAADNSDAISMAATNGGEFNVTLAGRTLWKDGDWNTLCLPFDLGNPQAEEGHYFDGTLLEGATVKTLKSTDFSDGTLTMNFVDVQEIAAGTPFLVKWTSGENEVNPVFTGVTISNATTNVETKYVDFIGTYAPVTYAEENRSVLFMGSGSNLYYPDGTSTITINACRAYFTLNGITAGDPESGGNNVKGFVLNFNEDDADGIRLIQNSKFKVQNEGEKWYDLAGRKRVNGKLSNGKLPKGIYIRAGKKILY